MAMTTNPATTLIDKSCGLFPWIGSPQRQNDSVVAVNGVLIQYPNQFHLLYRMKVLDCATGERDLTTKDANECFRQW